MKIVYEGQYASVIEAVKYTNTLAENEEFWASITKEDAFDNTSYKPADIASLMRGKETPAVVVDWRPGWFQRLRYRKTNALVDPSSPNRIKLNTRRLRRSIGSIVNTLVHEFLHTVDFTEDGSGHAEYTHRGQSSVGNENTAPYWIGTLAEKFHNLDQN